MKQRFSAKEMTTMALLAALLCVSSYISIQLPFSLVPITAQTIIINITALLLKPKRASLTVIIWILLGVVGLPVFSGGKGGFGVLAGATGGYIIGYLAAVIVMSLIKGRNNTFKRNLICVFIGIPIIYIFGAPWMMMVTGVGVKAAILTGVIPYLPGDVLKCILSVIIAKPLYKVVSVE